MSNQDHIADTDEMVGQGRKDDGGKLRFDLIPPDSCWKVLPRNKNYLVSCDGRVFSLIVNRVLKADKIWNGYLRVKLNDNKKYLVHRLVMESFAGESDLFVNHKNGIKTDNRLSNLEWCTKSENTKHAFSTGLMVKQFGEERYNAKLSRLVIVKIRQLCCLGATQTEVADLFNLAQGDVSNIVLKKAWGHVQDGRRIEV